MSKFEVKLRRNTLHTATLTVEAEDSEEATEKALAQAESCVGDPIDWEPDIEDFDVEDAVETEDDEDPDDEFVGLLG